MKVEVIGQQIPQQEIDAYIARAKELYPNKIINKMTITPDGDFVDLKYEFADIPFDRVRRITGYLVGTTDRWNKAKLSELNDRIVHD